MTGGRGRWLPTFGGTSGVSGLVYAMTVFDDGTGPALYAGGEFTSASGGPLNHVARWTGSGWAALGSGTQASVYALAVFDDGSGPALYAAGDNPASTSFFAPIMRWNGTSWSSVGNFTLGVSALATIDDGSGPALFAGGPFYTVDGASMHGIARWDGASWSPLGAGLGPLSVGCNALAQFEDDGIQSLLAGGGFRTSPARDSYLARWSTERLTRRP